MTSWGTPLCKYTSNPTETCDATILGSIMKGFRSLGLVPDFDKFILKSVSAMQEGIKGLRIEFLSVAAVSPNNGSYCYSCGGGRSNSTVVNHKNTCSFLPELHEKIDAAVDVIQGLSLGDFKGSKDNSAEASVGKWDLFDYK